MIRILSEAEWDMSELPAKRRACLDVAVSFEEIASRVLIEMKIIRVAIEPYRMPAPGEPKNARQVLFLVCVGDETCDLFYNARDGLRARYWQSPDHGFSATRYLIDNLMSSLISFAESNPPIPVGKAAPMASKDIKTSLEAPSAKIWPLERDDNGTSLLVNHQLMVSRWEENELRASINKGMWRNSKRRRVRDQRCDTGARHD